MDAVLRVDHLVLDEAPSSDTEPYRLKIWLNRPASEHEAKAFNHRWDRLASPEWHDEGQALMEGQVITFRDTSRQDFFLRHRARLGQVLREIEFQGRH